MREYPAECIESESESDDTPFMLAASSAFCSIHSTDLHEATVKILGDVQCDAAKR